MISPLLPLPRSLPELVQEALLSEPDFVPDWKWPLLLPRVGDWELVIQLCVGTSRATGLATGRVYAALDAGFGAYLIVCIDRDPQKLAERHKELLALMARARLLENQAPEDENQGEPENDLSPERFDLDGRSLVRQGPLANLKTRSNEVAVIPPQRPPPELYLKDALFRHLVD
jgi:hypothetical protein